MREFFAVTLSLVGAKGEVLGPMNVMIQHIVTLTQKDGYSLVRMSVGDDIRALDSVESIVKRAAAYGLIRVV